MKRRDDLLLKVQRMLVHRSFSEKFEPLGADGSRPIVAALREDSLDELRVEVQAAGGAANIVVPLLDGMLVFQMWATEPSESRHAAIETLDPACTVGVLIQRLINDGGSAHYRIPSLTGTAETVGNPRLVPLPG